MVTSPCLKVRGQNVNKSRDATAVVAGHIFLRLGLNIATDITGTVIHATGGASLFFWFSYD